MASLNAEHFTIFTTDYRLARDHVGDPVAAAYGPNYRRLRQLKAKYDPDNFFHMNQNIRPLP